MELYTIVIGAIAMLVIQFLKNATWPDPFKVLLTIAVSVLLSLGQWVLQNQFQTLTWQALLTNAAEILAVATILYKGYFAGVGWVKSIGTTKIL